jgi:hypothetical protein
VNCEKTMKTTKLILASLIIGAGAVLAMSAQSLRTDINPALHYYKAFLVAPDVSEADFDYLATNNLWSPILPEKFGEIVARYDPEFKLVRLAANSTVPCDWGIDMSEGPATLLPQLARCKAVMIGTRYRVAWNLQRRNQAEARDDWLAAFTLARNISRDGTVISVLVQIASESIATDTVLENFGKFSPQTLQQLVQGIDSAPAPGTVAASITFERMAFHDWLLRKIRELQTANPGDDAKVMAGIHDLMPNLEEHGDDAVPPSLWDQLTKASGNTSQGILNLLTDESQAYDRLASVMALPYSEFDAAANQFAAQLKHAQTPLLSQAFPAYLKARQREFRIQVWLAMLHTALEYKLNGDPGLLKVSDPCGQGPFAFQRFVLEGVDRGFQLTSAFHGSGFAESLIFVEKPGTPFFLEGPSVGQARPLPKNQSK